MNLKQLLPGALLVLLVIGALLLVFRIVTGAFALVGGLFNLVLGLAIVAALVIIVVWMFAYAKKHKK